MVAGPSRCGYASVNRRGEMPIVEKREPIFNVPGTVLAVLGLLLALHVLRMAMTPEQEETFVLAMAFIPARYAGFADQIPGGVLAAITSPFSHMLVHGDWVHLAFNSAWLLAFGGGIALRIGGLRFLALSIFCGLAGALAFLITNPGLAAPVVGASGAISGLMGATMRFLFSALDGGGIRELRETPKAIALMPLPIALRDRRILMASGVFMLLNVLAMFGIGAVSAEGGIAWQAHIGGYLAGLLGFGFFDVAQHVSSQVHNKPTLH